MTINLIKIILLIISNFAVIKILTYITSSKEKDEQYEEYLDKGQYYY